MANDEHVALLNQGVAAWNAWRNENHDIRPDLSGADLREANLEGANLFGADLSGADLSGTNLSRAALNVARLNGANLFGADLSGADLSGTNLSRARLHMANLSKAHLNTAYGFEANLSGANLSEAGLLQADLSDANLSGADLSGANLSGAKLSGVNLTVANLSGANGFDANLSGADLSGANLSKADLYGANLSGAGLSGANLIGAKLSGVNLTVANLSGAHFNGADLRYATLVDTDLTDADLTGCHIFGVSAWRLKLEGSKQENLVITTKGEPEITVDNIEVAQFIYLMLNNQKIRDVLDTTTSKVVLILGRFTKKRKPVLEALRRELRQREYLPIIFDFKAPKSRTTDETITLPARMARFVIADVTDAKSVLHELRAIVPDLPSVPVQPIILARQEKPGMFDFYRNNKGFLELYPYVSQKQLIADLGDKVIGPAELKVLDLRGST